MKKNQHLIFNIEIETKLLLSNTKLKMKHNDSKIAKRIVPYIKKLRCTTVLLQQRNIIERMKLLLLWLWMPFYFYNIVC